MSDHSFGERVVVVTGSSTGIGRAIATRFAALGDKVVLHGRTMSRELEQTHSSISEAGGVAAIVTSDYSEESFVDGFVDQVISRFGTPDVWINNAGGDVLTGGGSEMSLSEKLEFLWRVDVRSTLLLSRAVGNLMFEAAETVEPRLRPSLINVGWDQAWQGMAGESGELFATTK
ncbi:MAG: SDR family oxidoreductase, partial [Planctomycetota bacterium]